MAGQGLLVGAYVIVFDKTGTPLCEFDPESADRAWRLNEIGEARIVISRSDAKVVERYCRFGNLVAIQSDVIGLWGGVLLPPIQWDRDTITLTAQSAERLLQTRVLPRDMYFRDAPPGEIFERIIHHIHDKYQSNLRVSNREWKGGREFEAHLEDAYERVQELSENTGQDWWIEPFITENGQLIFKAHWFIKRGTNRSGEVMLEEGYNCADDLNYREEGTLVTGAYCVGKGDDWRGRPVGHSVDDELSGLYGLWERTETQSDVENRAKLTEAAEDIVEKEGEPERVLALSCINQNDLWKRFDVGDTLGISLVTMGFGKTGEVGFSGKVRVISKELDESQGYMPLAVKVKER